MVTRQILVNHLDYFFNISNFPDVSYNGLQFEGASNVELIATGVDANTHFVRAAREIGAKFAIVHHGIFWKGKEWHRIDRFARELIRELDRADLSLYAVHLPLDAHTEVGNNILLAKALELEITGQFGEFKGQKIGWVGRYTHPMSVESFKQRCERAIGPVLHHLAFGPEEIKQVGVVSGNGWDSVTDKLVYEGEIQAIVTGEVIHQAVALCRERGVHIFACGHYVTETFGVKELGEHLARTFNVKHHFIDLPTGF